MTPPNRRVRVLKATEHQLGMTITDRAQYRLHGQTFIAWLTPEKDVKVVAILIPSDHRGPSLWLERDGSITNYNHRFYSTYDALEPISEGATP